MDILPLGLGSEPFLDGLTHFSQLPIDIYCIGKDLIGEVIAPRGVGQLKS